MKISPALHTAHPWRVHTLAADFELLDVWELENIEGDPRDRFDRLFGQIVDNGMQTENTIVRGLFELRRVLGKLFRWDTVEARSIPGCTETTIVERLDERDYARTKIPPGTAHKLPLAEISYVYRFEDEALLEISNATIHALIHMSWSKDQDGRPRIAIYIKTRGIMSRMYMAAIEPFRMLFVYPAWTRQLADKFMGRAEAEARARAV